MGMRDELSRAASKVLRGGRMTKVGRVAASYAPSLGVAVLCAAMGAAPAHAQSLHWDIAPGDGAVTGGSGTWDDTTQNWTRDDGVTNEVWSDGAGAHFGGSGGTVTIDGTQEVVGLTFTSDGYTLTGGTIDFGSGDRKFITSTDLTTTINSTMTGSGEIEFEGMGRLILNSANSLSGVIRLRAGNRAPKFVINDNNALGTGRIRANGETEFTLSNSINLSNDFFTAGTINFRVEEGNTAELSGSNQAGFVGGIISKTGDGTLILSSREVYQGLTAIDEGTLSVASADPLGRLDGFVFLRGGTLQTTGNMTLIQRFELDDDSTLETAAGTTTTINTAIEDGRSSSGHSLTKTGGGTLVLGRTNTYTGDTIVADGTLSVAADDRLGATSGALTLDGGFLRATESFTTSRATTLASTGGFDVESGDTLTHDGVISGTGSLTKTGDGTLILTGTNTHSGGTNVDGGTLSAGSDATLGAASGGLTLGRGTLLTTGTFATSRGVEVTTDDSIVNVGAGTTLTVNGVISGTGVLKKFGDGTLVLTGTNTYEGGTVLDAGTISVASDGNLGDASGPLTLNGGTLQTTGTLTTGRTTSLTSDSTVDVAQNTTLTHGGDISGSGALEKTGGGTLVLRGASTYSGGTTISGGVISISSDAGLGDASGALTLDYGRLRTTGSFVMGRDINLAAPSSSSLQVGVIETNAGTTFTHDGVLRGSGNLGKGGNGTMVLNGANTLSGAIAVREGTLVLNHSEALGTGRVSLDGASNIGIRYGNGVSVGNELRIVSAGTLEVAGSDVAEQSGLIRTFAGEGDPGVTKTGSGTLILSAANTYSGDTTINGGTLSVSSDGNLGDSDNGLVLSGGVLRGTADFTTERATTVTGTGGFDVAAGTTLTHEGIISGTGRLTLDGDGTLIVTSKLYGPDEPSYDALAHSGGTTINSGTLQIGNRFNTSGSLGTGEVVNNGVLKLATGRPGTYANDISGTGTLVSSGNGSILLGNNSYGDTIIESGSSLRIGDTGTSGTLGTGIVYNDGSLVFRRSDTHTVTNDIVGENGFVVNWAPGTTILLGTNEMESMTVVEGAFQIGNGGTSGTLGASLSSIAGELIFNRSGELTERTQLSGSGTIIQRGSGTVTLTGEGTSFRGNTVVENGTLNVNNILGGDLRTEDGGTLGGSGTIGGNVTIEAGGTLAAGNSIGTLTVDSDLNLDAGSRLEIEVDPSGTTADLVAVGGRATLAGTAAHVGLAGDYAPSSSYTILTAAGGIDGTFGNVTSDFAFLDPRLTYGSNAVTLTLERNDIRFANAAHTRNQAAAASGLEGLGFDNATYSAVTVLDEDDAAAAFDMLSGEVIASAQTSMVTGGQAINAFAATRARSVTGPSAPPIAGFAPDPRLAEGPSHTPAWIRFLGSRSDLEGDGNAAGLETTMQGTLFGVEGFALGPARLGVLAGYTRSDTDVGDRASSVDTDSYHLGVYGRTALSGFALRGGVTGSWHRLESDRVAVVGSLREDLSSDTDARSLQSFAEIAYAMPAESYVIEPYAALANVVVDSDGTTETGGSSALTTADETTVTNFATVGARVGTTFDLGGMEGTLRGGLGWRHAFGDVTPTTTNRIAGGTDFTVAGTPVTRNVALVELGVGVQTSRNSTVHLSYDGEYGEGVRSHGARLDLVFRF